MRLIERDKENFSYELYSSASEIMDGDLHTGEYAEAFSPAVQTRGVITANDAETSLAVFGMNTDYTHIIITDDMNCPITETTRITYSSNEYAVKKVSKHHDVIAIGVSKVED